MSDFKNVFKLIISDLQTIEDRVNQQYYNKLSEFVGDVMRIFENCRFFNQPNSQIMKSAIALESFFASKLTILREKIAASWSDLLKFTVIQPFVYFEADQF